MLAKLGVSCQVFYGVEGLLRRLLPLAKRPRRWHLNWHSRIRTKLTHYREDRALLAQLRRYSAVIYCGVIPNAMWRNYYDIESLRRHLPGIPILLYEVYYLGNAPRMQTQFDRNGDFGIGRYDWHLSVSEVTEIRGKPGPPWTAIGLDLEHTALRPAPKKEFSVLLDFAQPGHESHREQQLAVLLELGITPIMLEGRYPMAEIRRLYQQACVYLMQSSEAFGLPIAECLYAGAYVFTPHSSWPMAFRLDLNPKVGGPGQLPEVFRVYGDAEGLRQQLLALLESYDLDETPYRISDTFCRTYPTFCAGDLQALQGVVTRIERGEVGRFAA
jgi:hypothetical protein